MVKKKAEDKKEQQDVNVKDIQNNSTENQDNEVKNQQEEVQNEEELNQTDVEAPGDNEESEEEYHEKKEQLLEDELNDLRDKYVRLSAEFDNYRKRTLKEKMELTKSAGESILLSILPVVDDFERGIDSMEKSKDIEAVKQGMLLVYNKFKEFLKQNGVKEIEARDQEFDTDEHDAVTKIPAPSEEQKGKVVDVIEKGYKLNDKVIRFSKVVVGE